MSDELLLDWLDTETEGDQLPGDAVSRAAVPISDQLTQCIVKPLRGDGPELILPV